jgi:hypothetical protein
LQIQGKCNGEGRNSLILLVVEISFSTKTEGIAARQREQGTVKNQLLQPRMAQMDKYKTFIPFQRTGRV